MFIASPQLMAAENAELDCLIRPEMYIDLSSPVDSTLKEMLVKTGDAIKKDQPLVQLESSIEKDKAETEVALAGIELSKAREKKQLAQLSLEQAQAELALRTIKSPIDGIVIDTYARVGESVADRTIMKLAQIDPLRVELIAPAEYFGLIKQGMKAKIYPERPANKTFQATVTVVDQLIDPASGSFTVRMAVPNPGDKLVGGVNCIARFDFKAS